MNQGGAPTNRRTWLIILFAMVMTIPIYGVLCYFMMQGKTWPPKTPPNFATVRLMVSIMAVAELAAAVAFLQLKTWGRLGEERNQLMSPQEFQTNSIISMALAEACTIMGLFLFFSGNPIENFAYYALGTLAVHIGFILPKGLKYWAAWEAAQEPQAPSPFS
jgi:F0F1-type ATP synthase membrane subunit c/vacuolar-type H+-ATPase subunit K